MWDNKAPLQLLSTMPKKLSKENLEKIQMVIDADKYKNSLVSGFDLCGMYAPFCRDCKKTSIYPCAVAYINMLKTDGMDVEIDAKPMGENAETPLIDSEIAVSAAPSENEVKEEIAEISVSEKEVSEDKTEDIETAKTEEAPAVSAVHTPVKHKIRIAVARKKL